MYKTWSFLSGLGMILSVTGCGSSDQFTNSHIDVAQDNLIPRAILFAKPDHYAVTLNHAGDKIAYLSRSNSAEQLVVEDLNGNVLNRFDVASCRNLGEYTWSANDEYILILQDKNGDENNHIVALNLKDGTKTDITPFDGARSSILVINTKNPYEIIICCNKRNNQWMDAYLLNIQTGVMTLLLENNKYASMLFDDKNDIRIATETAEDGGTNVYRFDNGIAELIKNISFEDSWNSSFVIQEKIVDNKWYYLSSENSDKNQLICYNLKTNQQQVLSESDLADICDIYFDKFYHDPRIIVREYTKPELFALQDDTAQKIKVLQRQFFGQNVHIVSQSANADSKSVKWIIAVGTPSAPLQYYLYDPKCAAGAQSLFVSQKNLTGYKFQDMQPVVIQARDGLELVCYLTKSSDASKKLIVYIHGGPWARDSYHFNKVVQFLANRGYSVLQVNYRGSSGFGKKFINAINQNLDKVRNDIIDAATWAIDNGYADKDKIVIMGGSFGGYSTLAGLAYTPDFFCAGVDIVGPSNWITLFSKVPPYWKPHMIGWYKCAGNPDTEEGRKQLQQNSPINFVNQIKKPLIVFQGEHDPRVNKFESDAIVAELKKRNVPVSYVLYPDEGHGFCKEANQISYLALTEQFLAKILNGKVEAIKENDLKHSSHQILEDF